MKKLADTIKYVEYDNAGNIIKIVGGCRSRELQTSTFQFYDVEKLFETTTR